MCLAPRTHNPLLPSLLDSLPHLLRLPLLLLCRARLDRNSRCSHIPLDRSRHLIMLRLHRHRHSRPLQPSPCPLRQIRQPRSSSSSHDSRLHPPPHRPLLVRMDLLTFDLRHFSSCSWYMYWHGYLLGLLASAGICD
jgi:hypothetical protein